MNPIHDGMNLSHQLTFGWKGSIVHHTCPCHNRASSHRIQFTIQIANFVCDCIQVWEHILWMIFLYRCLVWLQEKSNRLWMYLWIAKMQFLRNMGHCLILLVSETHAPKLTANEAMFYVLKIASLKIVVWNITSHKI